MATIYICGDEESNDDQKVFADTKKIKNKLKAMRCSVVNPTDMMFHPMSWTDKLQHRVELLKKSQAVYVLPNWKNSIMARIELTVAMDMRLHTFFHPVSNTEIKQIITTLDG